MKRIQQMHCTRTTATATILIVDDRPPHRDFLAIMLAVAGHRVFQAIDGAEALVIAVAERPHLVIAKILMPTMDGYEFVRQLRETHEIAMTEVIFYSAIYFECEAIELARKCGVNYLLSIPFDPNVVLSAVNAVLSTESSHATAPPLDFNQQHLLLLTNKLHQKVIKLESARECLEDSLLDLRQVNDDLLQTYEITLEGWSRALDLRNQVTEGHSQRVADLTVRLAREMGVCGEELTCIRRGALLHDIGKLGVPDNVLLKAGPLDESEWEVMKMHPVLAHRMLEPIKFLRTALDIPLCHHEKWDGSGYPSGLKREQIPLVARIFAIIDVWDALRSDRPYRNAWTEGDVRDYIQDQSGIHFDPEIVATFLRIEW